MSSANNGSGPCGACKFLRRKCVKGCIFAPYFDSDQGTAHFAAVHKVFGASNASKLLLRVPADKRLDAVITLCYEALSRVRDPVYGCVGHIFTLQQQVVNLQAELAYIQARLSTLQRLTLLPPLPPPAQPVQGPSQTSLPCSCEVASTSEMASNSIISMDFNQIDLYAQQIPAESISSCSTLNQELQDGELHALAREFVSRYLPGVRFKPPSSH